MYSEMIFVNGFVHCDPHPGNVLVRKCPKSNKTEIVLLDHGLYQVRHRPSLAGAHNKAKSVPYYGPLFTGCLSALRAAGLKAFH